MQALRMAATGMEAREGRDMSDDFAAWLAHATRQPRLCERCAEPCFGADERGDAQCSPGVGCNVVAVDPVAVEWERIDGAWQCEYCCAETRYVSGGVYVCPPRKGCDAPVRVKPPRQCVAHFVIIDGERVRLSEAARRVGINYHTITTRIKKLGWDVERALTTPPKQVARKDRAA
jgi:hypothetical protein